MKTKIKLPGYCRLSFIIHAMNINPARIFGRNKFVFTLLLLTFLFTNIIKAQDMFKESMNTIDYSGKDYSIQITKDPFRLTISNQTKVIAKLSGIISEDSSGVSQSKNLIRWNGNEKEIQLLISAGDKGFYSARFTPGKKNLQFSIISSDKAELNKIGLLFDAEVSGHWYGGSVVNGHMWPLEANEIKVDPFYAAGNQVSPVWYASNGLGLMIRTYNNMGYSFNQTEKGIFKVYSNNAGEFSGILAIGRDIKEAYYVITEALGKPSTVPSADFFIYPQFNTWIEFMADVNQSGIEKYTSELMSKGFPFRIFIIDDKWTRTYGDLEFDPQKFPDPSQMISKLHEEGFKVALWVTPFIERSALNFNYAVSKKFLLINPDDGSPYITRWWNGQAAIIDLSNPEAYAWFLGLLQNLQKRYGVDGFKFDAGDASFLNKPYISYGKIKPNEYADLFAGLGTYFELNELRVSWLTQSMGLIQRLRDKGPNWSEEDGIKSIIPHALTASIIGYSFLCPDMIGGGLDQGFLSKGYKYDEELFVRWTEVSALMPMMQYSLAPWKLSKGNMEICKKYSDLHVSLGDYIFSLAKQSELNGTPIVRPLFFEFPGDKVCFGIKDQFMLGERFLVAPVLVKGAKSRSIYLPEGTWVDFWSAGVITGGQTIEYSAPLDVLPIFIRVL